MISAFDAETLQLRRRTEDVEPIDASQSSSVVQLGRVSKQHTVKLVSAPAKQ